MMYRSRTYARAMPREVFRVGGDMATLSVLGVHSDRLMTMTPDFRPDIFEYEAQLPPNTSFSISASSAEYHTRVGIQYVAPVGGGASGLPDSENGCNLAYRQHKIWDVAALLGSGMYPYEICALAADGVSMMKYKLKVQVMPQYSVKLNVLLTGDFMLDQPFDPDLQSYSLQIPSHKTKVPLQVEAEHDEAEIVVLVNGKPIGDPFSI